MSNDAANTSPSESVWVSTPGEGLPWWLASDLTGPEGTVLVRCFAMLSAFLADALELPAGTMPVLLRAVIDDYNREGGAGSTEAGLRSLYDAARVAFG